MGDQGSVVREVGALVLGAFPAVHHFPFVEHTAAAVNDQRVLAQVFGESPARGEGELQVLARVVRDPPRNLHGPEILALTVMGTAFGHQNGVSVLELVHPHRTAYGGFENSLELGEQNRERSEQNVLRDDLLDAFEVLTVGDHHSRRLLQAVYRIGKLFRLGDDAHRVGIQHVADRLHLGQDHPGLRSRFVYRAVQDHDVALIEQMADDPFLAFGFLREFCDKLLELPDVAVFGGAYGDFVSFKLRLLQQVAFVPGDDKRNGLFPEQLDKPHFGISQAAGAVCDEYGHVGLVQDLTGLADAKLPDESFVIDPGRVDNHDRSDRKKLHRLQDRIRRRSLHFRDDGQILIRNRVDNAGFSGVALSEKSDVYPVGIRGLVQVFSHVVPF